MKLEYKGAGVPFHPRRFSFFYGWIILALSSLGILMSVPGQTIGVSVFTDSLMQVLGLSRVALSLSYLIGTVCSALILTSAGKLIDRIGARLIGSVVVLLLGLTLLGMANVDRVGRAVTVLLPFLGMATVGFAVVTLIFFLLRFLGQGVLTLISRNMTMKWFDRRRGIANAVLGTVVSFGFSYAPRVLDGMISRFGWRGALVVQAGILLAGFTALFLILARDNPYVCGLKPDGDVRPVPQKSGRQRSTGEDRTLKEARATLTFWVYALGLSLFSLFITAMTFHVVSIFEEAGMDRTAAVGIFFPAALVSLVLNFVASWASDRMPLKIFLLLLLLGMMLAMAGVALLDSGTFYYLLILGHGISGGLMNLINSVAWPRFFGIKHLGAISGFAMGLMVAGSAAGPYLFSLSLKYTGGYGLGSWICFGSAAILILLSLVSRPPAQEAQ